ncbi:MAG: hypothetical protein ACO1SV_16230 [Fimbriimonas sp.]
MGVSAALVISTITALTGTSRCDILCVDVRGTHIDATAMSPDGQTLLAQRGDRSDLTAIVFRGDQTRAWNVGRPTYAELIGIDNPGRVMGTYTALVKNGSMARAFLAQEGQYALAPIPLEPDPRNFGFRANAVGADGEIYGELYGDLKSFLERDIKNAAAIWRGNAPEIVSIDQIQGLGVVAKTAIGIIGYSPRWIRRDAKSSVAVGTLPALYLPSGIQPMRLPRGVVEGRPTAANADGSVILGFGTSALGVVTNIIWQDGEPIVPTIGTPKRTDARLRGVSADGKTVVGHIAVGRTTTALLWDRGKGLRTLEDVVAEKGIVLPYGWRLLDAKGITPDGQRVFGTAINRKNLRRPYLLWLGERPKKVR